MSKPLTPERRSMIEEHMRMMRGSDKYADRCAIEELLAAEQYWREAVKRVDPYVVHRDMGSDWESCRFCGEGYKRRHKADCPWRLAQGSNHETPPGA